MNTRNQHSSLPGGNAPLQSFLTPGKALIWLAVVLLSFATTSYGQATEELAQAELVAADREVQAAEQAVKSAEKNFSAAQQESYALARAVAKWRKQKKEDKRVSDLERVTNAHGAGKEKERIAQGELQTAQDRLAEAVRRRDELRNSTNADFANRLPPHLDVVKVYSGNNVVYHGRWIPKRQDLAERIAVLQAIESKLPEHQGALQRDLDAAIARTVTAIQATDAAMDNYVAAVVTEGERRRSIELTDLSQTLIRDTVTSGYVGLAISGVSEIVKAHRPGGSIDANREYWNINRLPGLDSAQGMSVDTAESLRQLGAERAYIQTLEKKRAQKPGDAIDTEALRKKIQAAADQAGNDAVRDALMPYAQVLINDSAKQVGNIAAKAGIKKFGNSENAAVRRVLKDLSGGDFQSRATGFSSAMKKVHSNFLGGLLLDEALSGIKDELLKAETKKRIYAYHQYVGKWVEQAWLEYEVIQISRAYWVSRLSTIVAQDKMNNLVRISEGQIERDRIMQPLVNQILASKGTYRLELNFSKPVTVDSVFIDDAAITGEVNGAKWIGMFRLEGLRERAQLRVSAHDDLSGHKLDNPHTAAYWSPEQQKIIGYHEVTDHYHYLRVLAPGGSEEDAGASRQHGATPSGITVAVADVFGANGLQTVPAPGVAIFVLDENGNTIAKTTTENTINSKFIELTPGRYTLRLDIGKYKSALPAACTNGYVRQIEVVPGRQLRFTAPVYSTLQSRNGTSVAPVGSDCIKGP